VSKNSASDGASATQFWIGAENHFLLPGCEAATIIVTKPMTVTAAGTTGNPYAGLKVYAFSGGAYNDYKHGIYRVPIFP
jgi:hypothetical protein